MCLLWALPLHRRAPTAVLHCVELCCPPARICYSLAATRGHGGRAGLFGRRRAQLCQARGGKQGASQPWLYPRALHWAYVSNREHLWGKCPFLLGVTMRSSAFLRLLQGVSQKMEMEIFSVGIEMFSTGMEMFSMGWRCSVLGWRCSELGWRCSALGWRYSALGCRCVALGWRCSDLG